MLRSLSLIFPTAVLGFAWLTALSGERHLSLFLKPSAAGHAHGHVEMEEESRGGTYVSLDLHGLEPGADYLSQLHHGRSDHSDAAGTSSEIGQFTANARGDALVSARVQGPIADLCSVDVHLCRDLAIVGSTVSDLRGGPPTTALS